MLLKRAILDAKFSTKAELSWILCIANRTDSVTKFKRNDASIIKHTDESPIAIFNHNRPES